MTSLQISIKIIWISRNLQTNTKTSLKLKQSHNKISTKKNEKKDCFKMPHVKISPACRIFVSHLNFTLSRKQRWKKTLFSLHSSCCSATKSLKIFSRVSFPASKFTPIKLIKKGLLQYSSLSRKKTALQYNSNSLNGKKGERLNNSHLRGWRWLLTIQKRD